MSVAALVVAIVAALAAAAAVMQARHLDSTAKDAVAAARESAAAAERSAVAACGKLHTPAGTGLSGLFLRVMEPRDQHAPSTAQAALADPANHIVTPEGSCDWTTYEVTAPIPDDTDTIAFGVFLAGPGRIELCALEFARDQGAGSGS
jgi:hypothetical protein